MAQKIETNLDLGLLELLGLRLENRATPPANPTDGTAYFHSPTKAVRVFTDGVWMEFAPVAAGVSPRVVVFTASGTFNKADYPDLIGVRVRGVAGGGGSGGALATASNSASGGAGGAGGGYFEKWIPAAGLAASETVTVGAGGTAGTVSPQASGGTGGTTSFGSHASANGGGGGSTGAPTTGLGGVSGPTGGAASGGDINIQGGDGAGRLSQGPTGNTYGGSGGGTPLGDGGPEKVAFGTAGGAGNAARGYGSASSGAALGNSTSAQNGLDGQPGIVIVEVYEAQAGGPIAELDAAIMPRSLVFTSSGLFNKGDYPNLVGVRVRGVAGGGGGGGTGSGTGEAAAAGGGGGGYFEKWVPVTALAASETVTVGAGGAGGATGGSGSAGGTTSFGSHGSATGGGGGSPMSKTSGNAGASAGSGGAGSGGDANLDGANGFEGVVLGGSRTQWGHGGPSALGVLTTQTSNANGAAGELYGSGGAGGSASSSASDRTGGAGGAGVVIIDLYEVVGKAVPSTPDASVTAWSPLSYQNNFTDADPSTPGQYRRVGDEVQLRGAVKSASPGAPVYVTTLPVDFRPPATAWFSAYMSTGGSPGTAAVEVWTDGTVRLLGYTATQTVALDGIRFSTL